MWELFTGPTMQRLVLYSTISFILSTLEVNWDDARFWCVIVCMLVLEHISHNEGRTTAASYLLEMPKIKLMKLKDFIDRVNRGEDPDEQELRKLLKDDDGTE